MRRARCNWHDRVIGTLLFVVVFLAATLFASPRNHDRRIDSHRKSLYSRALVESDGQGKKIDENVVDEPEATDFAEKPREFHGEPVETDPKLSEDENSNATSCAVVLLKKHPELCDVVDEILEIQSMLPRLHQVVARRMGGRRFNFVHEMVRGKTAFQHLYDTVKCMAVCIKKFVKFVGTVEGLIGSTTPDPVPDVDVDEHAHDSYDWYLTSMKKEYKDPVNPSFVAQQHFNPSVSRYTRRGSVKDCVASVMRVDPDVCGTLTKMELLDSILVTPAKTIVDQEPIQRSDLPLELDSENLVLGKLLDAVEESLADAGSKASVATTTEEARRHWSAEDRTRSRGRRRMRNDNDEEAAEVFQTSDFKIELVPNDDRRSFQDTNESRNVKNFMDVKKNFQGRRVSTVDERLSGLRDDETNERGQDLTKDHPSKIAQSSLRNVATGRSTFWPTQASRSLAKNSTSRNTEEGLEKTQNLSQNRRGSWEGLYNPDKTISRKTNPHARADTNTEGSTDEENKKLCEDKEADKGDWKQWLISKARDFSRGAFGA